MSRLACWRIQRPCGGEVAPTGALSSGYLPLHHKLWGFKEHFIITFPNPAGLSRVYRQMRAGTEIIGRLSEAGHPRCLLSHKAGTTAAWLEEFGAGQTSLFFSLLSPSSSPLFLSLSLSFSSNLSLSSATSPLPHGQCRVPHSMSSGPQRAGTVLLSLHLPDGAQCPAACCLLLHGSDARPSP